MIVSPASSRPSPFASAGVPAVRSRVSVLALEVGVVAVSGSESTRAPVGPVALAVAVLTTAPASTSAAVTV